MKRLINILIIMMVLGGTFLLIEWQKNEQIFEQIVSEQK